MRASVERKDFGSPDIFVPCKQQLLMQLINLKSGCVSLFFRKTRSKNERLSNSVEQWGARNTKRNTKTLH